jgi:soluble cytochrome b562
MKKPHLLLVATLLLAPVLLFAQPKKDRPDTDIEKDMHKIGRAYRQLRKQVNDPAQNASSLELVATIKASAQEAQKYTPLKAADLPEQDRAAFEASFQQKMGKFIDTVGQLEEAPKTGNNSEAARLAEVLGQLQKTDHKEFRRPEKDEMK